MKTKNKIIRFYTKITPERYEGVFSGITFRDFIKCTPIAIENILLLEMTYITGKHHNKFELFEGKHEIDKIALENIYNYGDFCFVDYKSPSLLKHLTENHIAELLYLKHMFKPLESPFFDVLQNNFAYLSHDDGWYCKIYCKESEILSMLLVNKIRNMAQGNFQADESTIPSNFIKHICELSTKGLILEVEYLSPRLDSAEIRVYEVGEYKNMDALFNSIDLSRLPVSLVEQVVIDL